jgi:uncharacterized lipoprotein
MRSNTLERLSRVVLSLALSLLLAGCSTAEPEPEDPYTDLPAQTYPFDLVWQCAVESLEGEGFAVANSQREGDEGGTIVTDYKVVATDQLSEAEDAVRIRVRVTRQGEKSYRLEMATSVFHREYRNAEWSYVRQDAELLKQLESGLQESLRKRYRGK